MDMDDKVIQHYLEMQKSQKLASEEAKRARAKLRRHPNRRPGYLSLPIFVPIFLGQ